MISDGRDPIIIDAGASLFEGRKSSAGAVKKSEMYINAYEKLGYDILNVGAEELSGGYEHLINIADGLNVKLLSANIYSLEKGEPLFDPYLVLEKGGLKVGVVGLISEASMNSPKYEIKDYLIEGKKVLKELEAISDVQIVLVNAPRTVFNNLKDEFTGAEYIFTSGGIMHTRPNTVQDENKPFLYAHQKQGKYVADIRLELNDPSKPITDASGHTGRMEQLQNHLDRFQAKDSTKTFQELYQNSPNLLKMIEKYQVEVEESKKFLTEAVNKNEYRSIPMDRSIKDHPDYTALVVKALSIKN